MKKFLLILLAVLLAAAGAARAACSGSNKFTAENRVGSAASSPRFRPDRRF